MCQQLIGYLKQYHNFSHVVMCFFSVVGMLTKHSSLYNKLFLLIMLSLLLFLFSEFTNYSYLLFFINKIIKDSE